MYEKGNKSTQQRYKCKKCGYEHKYGACPAYGKTCAICKEMNHFAKGCSKRKKKVASVESNYDPNNVCEEIIENKYSNSVSSVKEMSELYLGVIELHKKVMHGVECRPGSWYDTVMIKNGHSSHKVRFKLDTGAESSVLPLDLIKELWPDIKIHKTRIVLVAFGGSTVIPEGNVSMLCSKKNSDGQLISFMVVKGNATPILGAEACVKLNLIKRVEINEVKQFSNKEQVFELYKEVFDGLGQFSGQHHIELKANSVPVVHPPRRVPQSLHKKLKLTLDSLQKRKIIQLVNKPTEWVNSLVIVEKTNGDLRLCLDPRDLNKAVKREHYMIPRAEDLIIKLKNKTVFSVIDMQEGFWQIELDNESAELCTFNTPFGRYRFHRLPYGLCSAPEVFQRKNNETFGDIEGCDIYFDDLIIAGSTVEEHDQILKQVLDKARVANVKFNKNKFQFRVAEVKYVGQVISKHGTKPDPSQVRAIIEMGTPGTRTELLRLLGMSKYLSSYIAGLSEITAPLRDLTKHNIQWQWLPEHDRAVLNLKNRLASAPVLAIFDGAKEVTVQVDASQHGLGACLMQNGHPVAYASRSLTETEQRYAQIEKELLAIVFGVVRFHHFTYGRLVHVQTDHKPLESIFMKDLSKVTARLQRMLLKLLKYTLDVRYTPGKYLYVADTLSRSFLEDKVADDPELKYVIHSFSKHLPISKEKREKFVEATGQDPALAKLITYYFQGWPDQKKYCSSETKYYWKLKDQIAEEEDLVFLDHKLISGSLQDYVLGQIHESHMGIVKSKARARQIVYWPGMSSDIESLVSKCPVCQKFSRSNCRETMMYHETPDRPWQRLATDILQFGSNDYLVVTDYYSRWIELEMLTAKTARSVISKIKAMFSRFGIPDVLISDNMPFDSLEFKQFASEWDFKSITSSPHYPQSNGLAEKSVSIVKNMLRKSQEEGKDIFVPLMEYRNTPLNDVGVSPAQLMLNRRIKTKLPACEALLQPQTCDLTIREKLEAKNKKTKQWYDTRATDLPPLQPGDSALIQKEETREPGMVVKQLETPRSYVVRQADGRELRKNRRHLRTSHNSLPCPYNLENLAGPGETNSMNRVKEVQEQSHDTSQPSLVTTRSGQIIKKPEKYIEEY